MRSFAFICGGFKLWKVWSGLETSGFTALELLITVAILGLVTSLAVPALRDFVLEKRAVSGLNEFMAAVNFARNEAVRRGVSVTLCASVSPQAVKPACDARKRWESGWVLFADYDRNARLDPGTGACLIGKDCLLRVWDGIDDMTLRARRVRMTFDSLGAARGFNATWRLCDERGVQAARAVILAPSGRLWRARDSDGNGIPNSSGGNDISCP